MGVRCGSDAGQMRVTCGSRAGHLVDDGDGAAPDGHELDGALGLRVEGGLVEAALVGVLPLEA
eukprot:6644616-Prymnesium_polylepis.1